MSILSPSLSLHPTLLAPIPLSSALSTILGIDRISPVLMRLDLGYNTLTDISPLAALPALRVLNLEYNQMYVLVHISILY